MTKPSDRADFTARETEMAMQDWLQGGLKRADGRLAIFDMFGEPIDKAVVKSAIAAGLAEPWFSSPMRPQWTVCRLTPRGRDALNRFAKTR